MNDLVLTASEQRMLVTELRRAGASHLLDAHQALSQETANGMRAYAHALLELAAKVDGSITVEALLDSAYAEVKHTQQYRRVA